MMKKTFQFLSVIVFLATILYVVGCCPGNNGITTDDLKEVTIYLKSVEINGVKYLLMFDSNTDADINNLKTVVREGGKVKWTLAANSGIVEIDRIFPNADKPKIFLKEPTQSGKYFILDVPADVEPGTEEKYLISFTLDNKTKVTIDPYLRIPE